MQIIKATSKDLNTVVAITHTTIREIYPRYYPKGAVEFFLSHHSSANIISDINKSCVFLCTDEAGSPTGTITIRQNEICRLFVLPAHQGKGYGRALLDFAENEVLTRHSKVVLDASLPAKSIYLKRGYKDTAFNIIKTENGDFLCYDVMQKCVN